MPLNSYYEKNKEKVIAQVSERAKRLRVEFNRMREDPTYEPSTPYNGTKYHTWKEAFEANERHNRERTNRAIEQAFEQTPESTPEQTLAANPSVISPFDQGIDIATLILENMPPATPASTVARLIGNILVSMMKK